MSFNTAIKNLLFLSLLLTLGCSKDSSIRLGITTTLNDSEIASYLIQEFEKNHDITIKPIVAGSGQILDLIKRGDIDTAITHDPAGETKLLEEKLIQTRTPLVLSDFIIVGPANDPAHIKLSLTPDEALQKIANANATFISRGDNSGTSQMELYWRDKFTNRTPGKIITTGTGMGATLTVAAEKNAYTLVDRATWLHFQNKQSLALLFEEAEFLANQYSLLSFSEFNKSKPKKTSIDIWEAWISTGEGHTLLKNYRINNQPIFK